jgi:repressor LexA
MTDNPLTDRQQGVLDQLRRHLHQHGRPPTLAELTRLLGVRSTSVPRLHLKALQRKGYVRLTRGSRGIELTDKARPPAEGLPLLGQVPAGRPVEALEHAEHYLGDLRALFPTADYLLRVRGDSMRDAGILDGDLVAVRRVDEARHGDIVIARLNGEDTLKRLYHRDGRVRLVPENSALDPIEVDPAVDAFEIDGVYVGVVRVGGVG